MQPASNIAAKEGLASFLQYKLNQIEKTSANSIDNKNALTRATSVVEETSVNIIWTLFDNFDF